MPPIPPGARARRLVLACHGVLILALPLLAGMLGALAAAPLLLPLPGLWRGRPRTYAWASLLIVLYSGAFLMEAFAQAPRRAAALALALVAVVECCALLLFVRAQVAARRAA